MKNINILVPDLPESVTDATVIKWHKKIGDKVYCDDNIVDIETDKVMLEVSSPCDGILKKILKTEGENVCSQQLIGEINQTDEIKKNIFKNIKNEKKDCFYPDNNIKNEKNIEFFLKENNKYLSPSIRRLIRLNEVNDSYLRNQTKLKNKINEKIFSKKHKEKLDEKSFHNHFLYTEENDKKEGNKFQNRVKITRIRQTIAERLLYSKNNTAMLTTFNEVNMKPIMLLRKKYGEYFEKKYSVKIGFMSFFVKAVVQALKKFPQINASIDKPDIIFYKNFDISIAISTPRGLITPVLRNADKMSMSEIENKIKEFAIKGLHNQISLKELTGGNFTITNGGVFGSLMSTPIINPPQAAILGMHAIQERPIVINGKIKILPMMYLALSYDHCLIDGKESVSFLVTIKNILEDFTRILIDI